MRISFISYLVSSSKEKHLNRNERSFRLGCFDGTILVASSSQVSSLLPVPWQVKTKN